MCNVRILLLHEFVAKHSPTLYVCDRCAHFYIGSRFKLERALSLIIQCYCFAFIVSKSEIELLSRLEGSMFIT
jgi:hypothetical protein